MVLMPDLPCVLVRPNTASEDNCHPWTFGKLMVSLWSVETDTQSTELIYCKCLDTSSLIVDAQRCRKSRSDSSSFIPFCQKLIRPHFFNFR